MSDSKKTKSSKTKAKPKKCVISSDDEDLADEFEEKVAVKPKKSKDVQFMTEPAKPKKTKKIELCPEAEDEEQIVHYCGDCGKDFECKDGIFNKQGKFRCSCFKEKDHGEIFFFCSEECLQGDRDNDDEEKEQDDDGYFSV